MDLSDGIGARATEQDPPNQQRLTYGDQTKVDHPVTCESNRALPSALRPIAGRPAGCLRPGAHLPPPSADRRRLADRRACRGGARRQETRPGRRPHPRRYLQECPQPAIDCLGKPKNSRMSGLITRVFGHPAGGTEDARRCTTPYRIDVQGAGVCTSALGITKFQPAALTQPSSRAYSSSIKLSSSFLNNGAGLRNACPAGSSLGVQVPMARLWS
jgi:hypothetical protein